MCKHVFNYPEDKPENYNKDRITLTGVCRNCGIMQISYGISWAIPITDKFKAQSPYGETEFVFVDEQ